MSYEDPVGLKAEIIRSVARSPHRSTLFMLQFDIGHLMDENNHPLVSGEELEEILYRWARQGIRSALERGRSTVRNHP